MTQPLLRISAFARTVDLAASTLRYYDEIGLLRPAEVDDQTGYRFYTPELERRAHMIRRMREVGVPVETMRRVLDGPADQGAELLQDIARRATESAQRTTAALADVVASLHAAEATPEPTAVGVDGPELASALRRVSRAAAADPESPLAVVLLDLADHELCVVATDRYWLARWSIPLEAGPTSACRVTLPVSEIDALIGWLVRQEQVTLCVEAGKTRVISVDEDRPVATAPDRFPAYRLVFDAQPPTRGRVTVDREQLLRAIAGDAATVLLRVGPDRMAVRPHDADEGVHLAATTSGEPVTLAVPSMLLHSASTALVGTEATLSYAEPDRAVWLTSADQRSFTALIQPTVCDQ